jgi:hypothetical protein
VKGKAGDIAVWGANVLPSIIGEYLRADRAGGVLDQRHTMPSDKRQNAREVARHAHLMHTKNHLGARSKGRRNLFWIYVEVVGADVHEDRLRAAVSNNICCSYEARTDGDHLVTRSDANRNKCQM